MQVLLLRAALVYLVTLEAGGRMLHRGFAFMK